MDEEISKLVGAVTRCGPVAVRQTIVQLERYLNNLTSQNPCLELPQCRTQEHRRQHIANSILGWDNVRIVGDFVVCNVCDEKLTTSVFPCMNVLNCQVSYPYMIGDRDFMRSRCRWCNGIIGSMEHYPKSSVLASADS